MYLSRTKQALENKTKYDLVNYKDRIIKIGTKREAEKLKLFTRSVHILLTNKKGEILVSRRPSDARRYPNKITSSAGGHVEKGESYKTAAVRELGEELNITTLLKDLGRFDVMSSIEHTIHHLFTGKVERVLINKNEIAASYFVPLKVLSHDMTLHPKKYAKPFHEAFKFYSTVTLFARLRGRSTSRFKATAI